MAKISYFQRNGIVYVRHTYHANGKSSDYTRTTEVKVSPEHFDRKTGKVSRQIDAPELNEAIAAVVSDIAKAARNLGTVPPTRPAIEQAVKEIEARRALQADNAARVVKNAAKVGRLNTFFLDELKEQLADLEAQVQAKKAEIREWELKTGINDGRLLTDFILHYAGEFPAKGKDNPRRGEVNLKSNTIAVYDAMRQMINDFKPSWRIDDVSNATLLEFQQHLLAVPSKKPDAALGDTHYKNSTILLFVRRVKSIVRHYADREGLDLRKMQTHKAGIADVADRNIIALTDTELSALRDMELPTLSQQRVRDQFVLMAVTSLRYSDLAITPAQVQGKYLVVRTEKKGKVARIPICRDARTILERYAYTIKPSFRSYFSKTIKAIGKKLAETVPSLAELEEVVHLNGVDPQITYVPRHTLLSAHVGRKTMISKAVTNKMSISILKGITTHSKMDTLLNHYAARNQNAVEEMDKVFSME